MSQNDPFEVTTCDSHCPTAPRFVNQEKTVALNRVERKVSQDRRRLEQG